MTMSVKEKSAGEEEFALRVSKFRGKTGLSQEKLAELLAVSRNYVSMIEGGRRPSEVVVKLFETLENSPLYNGTVAPSESPPKAPRQNKEFGNALRAYRTEYGLTQAEMAKKLRITRAQLEEAESSGRHTLAMMVDFYGLCSGTGDARFIRSLARKVEPDSSPQDDNEKIAVSWIPLLSWAQAGEAVDCDELLRHMQKLVPSIVDDPKAFAIEIAGDSQEPRYSAGDIATVVPSKSLRQNDTVIARLVDQGVVLKLYSRHGDTVRFSSYNPAYAPFEVPLEQIEWIYPVESVLKVIRK